MKSFLILFAVIAATSALRLPVDLKAGLAKIENLRQKDVAYESESMVDVVPEVPENEYYLYETKGMADAVPEVIYQREATADVIPKEIYESEAMADEVAEGVYESEAMADEVVEGVYESKAMADEVAEDEHKSEEKAGETPEIVPQPPIAMKLVAGVLENLRQKEELVYESEAMADEIPEGAYESEAMADEVAEGAHESEAKAAETPEIVPQPPIAMKLVAGLLENLRQKEELVYESEGMADVVPKEAYESEGMADEAPEGAYESEAMAGKVPAGAYESEAMADEVTEGAYESEAMADVVPEGAYESEAMADEIPEGAYESEAMADEVPEGAYESEAMADVAPESDPERLMALFKILSHISRQSMHETKDMPQTYESDSMAESKDMADEIYESAHMKDEYENQAMADRITQIESIVSLLLVDTQRPLPASADTAPNFQDESADFAKTVAMAFKKFATELFSQFKEDGEVNYEENY